MLDFNKEFQKRWGLFIIYAKGRYAKKFGLSILFLSGLNVEYRRISCKAAKVNPVATLKIWAINWT